MCLCSSRLLDVVFPGLRCGGQVHFCDVYGSRVWINMGPDSHIVSFMALKGLRVIHIPGSLVGYEPQFITILNGAQHGCKPSSSHRLNLTWRLIANVSCESDAVHDKEEREDS